MPGLFQIRLCSYINWWCSCKWTWYISLRPRHGWKAGSIWNLASWVHHPWHQDRGGWVAFIFWKSHEVPRVVKCKVLYVALSPRDKSGIMLVCNLTPQAYQTHHQAGNGFSQAFNSMPWDQNWWNLGAVMTTITASIHTGIHISDLFSASKSLIKYDLNLGINLLLSLHYYLV